jgi:hypothetical protein
MNADPHTVQGWTADDPTEEADADTRAAGEGVAAQREYFTVRTRVLDSSSGVEKVHSVCALPFIRDQLQSVTLI